MIQRFYVHNYRCLENFVLPIGGLSSALLIGKNGSGKSTVSFALEILQKIGRGVNRVGKLLSPQDISHGRSDLPVRLELEVELAGARFEYTLAFELPAGWRELRVLEERLTVAGQSKFTRQVADMRFPRGGGTAESSMSVDWHLVGLPLVQARSEKDPVHVFQQWLARMLILRPIPAHIDGNSSEETLQPNTEVSNLGDWWAGLLAHAPAAYAHIDTSLRQIMPDLKDIKNPLIAKDARSLNVQFASDASLIAVPFERLSDGEKCMVIWALTLAANEAYGPLFCFWDEPDNYLALSEIGDFATDLRKAFQSGGQFIATSHNAEAIKRFSDENTFVLYRRNHLEPTQVRSLEGIPYSDLVGSLVRGRTPAMSANIYAPHLLVLLEDRANEQILNGFINHHMVDSRRMQFDPVVGGWERVLERFRERHAALMAQYPERQVLIVIDFDEQDDRFEVALSYIPGDLRDRVFVIGCADEPERLAACLGCKKERIGQLLAEDCDHDTNDTWGHKMLAHNAGELARLRIQVKPFLFRAA